MFSFFVFSFSFSKNPLSLLSSVELRRTALVQQFVSHLKQLKPQILIKKIRIIEAILLKNKTLDPDLS